MTATVPTKLSQAAAEFATAKVGTLFTDLPQFGLIRFTGEDAQSFLHGQLSCDVSGLQAGHAQYGSYNTPQGRMLASFLLWHDDLGYAMQLPQTLCASIQVRLARYILRAKVTATNVSGECGLLGLAGANAEAVLASCFPAPPAAVLTLTTVGKVSVLRVSANRYLIMADPENTSKLKELLSKAAAIATPEFWNWLDIRAGIAYITPETQDQFVPQMANLDLIGGVSFSKGCYPGQEIVARMHYLGRLKQRMYLANLVADEAPAPGDKLYSEDFGGQACGMIVNAAPSPDGGHDVLAVMQIESADRGAVHYQSPAGAALRLLELPYKP